MYVRFTLTFLLLVSSSQAFAAEEVGIEKRIPWTTSRFRGRPEPPLPYRAARVFSNLSFKNPTVLTSAPGTDRLFVAEQSGKVYSIPDDPDCKEADLFLDAAELVAQLNDGSTEKNPITFGSIYGLTFHPRFAENRYCYLCYVVNRQGETLENGSRVVRLTVSKTDPPKADPKSEKEIITWLVGGHNGGCIKFGLDDKLYITTGDGAGPFPPDSRNAGQDVSNLLSALLRIDVDHPDGDQAYSIPKDNPFVDLEGACGEIYAYGFRNPWKMSVDRETGKVWIGDVGWERWELVYRVNSGDNFGWSLVEGPQSVHAERRRGPTPIVPPTVPIPHTDGASVTGGFVYRGTKFPELVGTYIFGDWETRRVWGVNADADEPGPHKELIEPTVRVVGFAEDNEGELYLLDYDAGTIHEVVRNEVTSDGRAFPRVLSDSGIFKSIEDHVVADGVVAFDVNAELWADHAHAERYVGVPGLSGIRLHASSQSIEGSMFKRAMDFPKDTILLKTLSLDLVADDPRTRKRIETQILHYDGRHWRGYTYEWNDDHTNAVLVERQGVTRTFKVRDANAPGGTREQSWRFPSRMECIRCHNPWAEHALGFSVAQLNRDRDYDGRTANQIETLRNIGVLNETGGDDSKPRPVSSLQKLADPFDETAPLNDRGRAYLHANCAHCHRMHGGGAAKFHVNIEAQLSETQALGTRPTQGTFGIADAQILAPGDPLRSLVYFRMAKAGPGHMPRIGSNLVHDAGLRLIREWITGLPIDGGKKPGSHKAANKLARLTSPETKDRLKLIMDLLAEPASALMLADAFRDRRLDESTQRLVLTASRKTANLAVRDLFEPFVPTSERVKRLGESINPTDILSLSGNIEAGRQLFHVAQNIQCRNCHRIGKDGKNIGPDLTQVGKKNDRAKLLESILEPSKNIDPKFVTWLVETSSGKVYSGLLINRSEKQVVIRDAQNKEHKFATDDVDGMFPQRKSLMPELLLKDMTARQVADLLAYLVSLK